MPEQQSVITVGTFDGVHLGHREILRRVRATAAAKSLRPVIVTFRPHPLAVVNPSAAPMLLTPDDEQLDALHTDGPLEVVVLDFTPDLARHTADEFVREILIERFRVVDLVIGYDHGLGRGRQGDATALQRLGAELGFAVDIVPAALDVSGAPISSSSIRTSIAHGDLERAKAALGRPYAFAGTVVHGEQRGRELGYPTINAALSSSRKLLPPDGVYAVRARTARGVFGGMMNLGGRPTFGDLERTLEVHLFDVNGDWYGERVSVDFLRRLRDTIRFDGVDQLIAQLAEDAKNARFALTQA
ncbi:MAG TPA: bifunctional riboflavin kinase/FAD synthetase [Gemmatimonadaceae bacterium]|jgi:riboflavin kinase/FMN adenylyltransferase